MMEKKLPSCVKMIPSKAGSLVVSNFKAVKRQMKYYKAVEEYFGTI